jgi:nitrogen fixation NifU-like protein
LCDAAWTLFETRRESVEREREYLLANRVHDEFWYAEYFHLPWPVRPRIPAVTSQANFPQFASISGSPDSQHPGSEPAESLDDELLVEEAFERYLDHYQHPRNRQVLPQAQAVGRIEWAGGAMLTFYLQLTQRQEGSLVIERAAFQSQRCGIAVAYASLLSEWVRGRPVEEAWRISPAELMQQFGPRAGAIDAAGRAISALRQALAQVPGAGPTDPIGA